MKLPHPGEVLEGKYRLEEMLGEGAFGLVVKATTLSTNRPVAVKLLKPTPGGYHDSRAQRFLRELRVIAKLQCPNTLTLFDYGRTDEGVLYMVTEYVEGEDLYDLLKRRGSLSEREVQHILHQTLLSLAEAHEHGVLHRDIKPHNIRLSPYQDDPLRVKVLDFGLSKTLEEGDTSSGLTKTGIAVGTPRYMSPEQLSGKELTAATDIYSLGLVAYEMVMGENAAGSDRVVGPGRQVRLETTAPVSQGLRLVINRMLAKPVVERYASAAEVLADLRAVRSGGAPADRSLEMSASSGRFTAADTEEDFPVRGSSRTSRSRRSAALPAVRAAPPPWRKPAIVVAVVAGVGLLGLLGLRLATSDPEPEPSQVMLGTDRLRVVAPAIVNNSPPPNVAEPEVADAEDDELPELPELAHAPQCQGLERFAPGVQTISRMVGITREDAVVYIPPNYDPRKRYPMVWAFHDYFDVPTTMLGGIDYDSVADLEPFIIVAPRAHRVMSWSTAPEFDRALGGLDLAREFLCVDPDRIYVWGHGLGGRFATRQAMCMDAVAAVATTNYRERRAHELCEPDRVVPYLHVASLKDRISPADGGQGCLDHFMPHEPMTPIAVHENFFIERNQCEGSPRPRPRVDHGECVTWRCAVPFVSCRVDGGRQLPNTPPYERKPCQTDPVAFPYVRQVLEFFSQFSRPPDDNAPQ